jgi:KamA family protein
LGRALEYIASEPSVEEVIFSGGDPLSLTDEKLARLTGEIAEIPHVRRLRVHTRLPIVLPGRVDEALLAWISESRLTPVMAVHVNHAREIDGDVRAAFERLRRAGVLLMNQAVLLAGVNDSVEALAELGTALVEGGVVPYYLHLLDPVVGAAHFDVEVSRDRLLVRELLARTSGYLVPRLVCEVPGAPAKTPIDPGFVTETAGLSPVGSRKSPPAPPFSKGGS